MVNEVVSELGQFIQKYILEAHNYPSVLKLEYDSDWPSDCFLSSGKRGEMLDWKPVKREGKADFGGMESALDMKIHPDIIGFYSEYWSDNLNAKTTQGSLQLLQVWNPSDFERLQQNLIGHILMKRRLKQPETLFFALTDEDDYILTLDNMSGEVMLEQVGLQSEEILAPNLAEFISTLSPDFS